MYTINDAKRECKELFAEGYGFSAVRIFLHDLARGKDITWKECEKIMEEIINGELGDMDCSIATF